MRPFANILFARDFTPGSEHAAPLAIHLARASDARLHVFHADPLTPDRFATPVVSVPPPLRLREYVKQAGEERRATPFDPASVRIEYAVERGVEPARAIVAYARAHGVDLIVMGTHGRRGLRRWLLGSVAEAVVRHAPCPVLAVREPEGAPAEATVHTLLVPVDFSPATRETIRHARALASLFGAELALLHVIEKPSPATGLGWPLAPPYEASPTHYAEAMDRLKEAYHATGGPDARCTFTVRTGAPADEVVRYAEETHADLIVMATRGRTGADRFLLGSVAEAVARRAPCGVFLHRLDAARRRRPAPRTATSAS